MHTIHATDGTVNHNSDWSGDVYIKLSDGREVVLPGSLLTEVFAHMAETRLVYWAEGVDLISVLTGKTNP